MKKNFSLKWLATRQAEAISTAFVVSFGILGIALSFIKESGYEADRTVPGIPSWGFDVQEIVMNGGLIFPLLALVGIFMSLAQLSRVYRRYLEASHQKYRPE